MPIKHSAGGTTITGDSIDYFRLCVARSAVHMESVGLRVRQGRVVWKQIAREYGIKGNRAAVLTWLEQQIDALRVLQEHQHETADGRLVREVNGIQVQ